MNPLPASKSIVVPLQSMVSMPKSTVGEVFIVKSNVTMLSHPTALVNVWVAVLLLAE